MSGGWEKNPKEKKQLQADRGDPEGAHEWGIDCRVPEGEDLKGKEAGDVWACETCGARHQLTDAESAADPERRAGWTRLPRE